MSRILSVLHKEFLQMKRDRLTIGLVFMLPLVQLLLFGFAIQTEVKHIPTVVFDQSLSAESRELLESFTASGYFDITEVAGSYDDVTRMIDKGAVKVGIIFPPDFAVSVRKGETAPVQVLVDATDSMVSNSAVATANAIGLLKAQKVIVQKTGAITPPYDIRVRPWYNPDGITAYYMVPAILGIIVTMTMVMMTSMGIVRERERGTLEQLIVTPIKSYELMIGKIIPYIALGYVQITVALLVGTIVFGVPIRGSLLQLYLLTLFFITASLGLGVLISNLAKTQMQAMQMSFFILLPSILLSGFMFPRDAMPPVVQYLSNLIPLTFYLTIIRGIVLKGIGFSYLLPQVTALLVFTVVLMVLSIAKFKKKIA
ncbi:ABC transporter permease [Desulforamulus hydrothermalis]|uniref:Transport permease protein n=1 Tax=Desulforamulus hydrothermalis Lam5 = DSM 18033 TaxID=1121428 RepID=K8DXE6_9FIRM|nr:ABC transporter permease [Desulforamulus hydrothermalis]CCO07287.1 ABC-2 type transporter [Desulforamulus hydrothermalis Lam5 = DSM 18033]SHG93223.1 ABC-2 type transport system permease protein [Desulforamulus hydrothermalis Lam5 = DSM 18033]